MSLIKKTILLQTDKSPEEVLEIVQKNIANHFSLVTYVNPLAKLEQIYGFVKNNTFSIYKNHPLVKLFPPTLHATVTKDVGCTKIYCEISNPIILFLIFFTIIPILIVSFFVAQMGLKVIIVFLMFCVISINIYIFNSAANNTIQYLENLIGSKDIS